MTALKSRYLTAVRRRLSEVALQRGDSVIEKPAVVRSDIRVMLQALNDAEAELAKYRNATNETENGQSVEAP